MGANRKDGRHPHKHAFRPSLEGQLERRELMSSVPAAQFALYHPVRVFTRNGGRGVRVLNGQGSAFDIQLTGPGAITAQPLFNGTVKLTVFGSNITTEMVIDPVHARVIKRAKKNQAHQFHDEFGVGNNVLNVGAIDIKSGIIGSILGFRTADLSGPITISGTLDVNRIALNQLLPGASITTGGTLDTLDIFGNAILSGAGTGITTGTDLDLLNIGGNFVIENGAQVSIGRDLGLTPQPPKGSSTGSNILQILFNGIITTTTTAEPLVSAYILGSMAILPGSQFKVARFIDRQFLIEGNLSGASRFSALSGLNEITVLGGVTA